MVLTSSSACAGLRRERGDGDRIAERIVDPAHRGGGLDRQLGVQQTQVVAVARPEHQTVVVQRHRLGVFVAGAMDDLERAHVAE